MFGGSRYGAARAVRDAGPIGRLRESGGLYVPVDDPYAHLLTTEADLASVPEALTPHGVDTASRRAPGARAWFEDADEGAPAASLLNRTRVTEGQVWEAFVDDLAARVPGGLAQFDTLLGRARRILQRVGRRAGLSALSRQPEVRSLDQDARALIVGAELPEWYVTLTGRLFPLYAAAGAQDRGNA